MFVNLLHICYFDTIIKTRNFEHVFCRAEVALMNDEKRKRYIIEMIQEINNSKYLERIFNYVHRFFIKKDR